MHPDQRNLYTVGADETLHWEKSPFIQGFLAGVKGAIAGAGAGSLVNAVRGANPITGALIGGAGVGLLSGVAKALSQDVDNTNQEAALRYHLLRLGQREPMIYMPPPRVFGPLFNRLHHAAHVRARGQEGT